VHEQLSQNKEAGYTTTLKLMQIMTEKGFVQRDETSRTHVYVAVVSEADAQKQLLDRFLETAFGGSAAKLVMQALGNHQTSRQELDEIRQLLDKMENRKDL
jgi:predicted transcriptional regulator